ncbi:hypothetical protein LA080_008032 [Diaporthe eres]|nr:hypothetical protein LA080_008032 [Diaporthe eres]
MEELDLVVIDAAAKTFSQLSPNKFLVIFESAQTLGGVWARERLYPGLKTNNMLGTYEYPDFPMSPDMFGVRPGQHIPGRVCHEYLGKYAEKYSIADKIRYTSRVVSAEHKESGGWMLKVCTVDGHDSPEAHDPVEYQIVARKLVVATGLTSEPFRPRFNGEDTYSGKVFHIKDFPKYAETLNTARRVTVFGGTKSGWDAVYAYATRGIQVDWVIRSSGHGPSWMAPPYVTPLKKWLEKLVMTRLLTWFSPCIWGPADGYGRIRSFLHGTRAGRFITDRFWSILGNDVLTLNKYDSHPETAKIKPWSHPMFVASGFPILNYDTDFFELVRSGAVKVHIADVTRLSARSVHLSDGTELESEAMCCVTGWKWTPPLKFLPEGIDEELGIPHAPTGSRLSHLVDKADREILDEFPRLKDPPVQNSKYVPLTEQEGVSASDGAVNSPESTSLTPWTLYHFMVPPSQDMLKHRDVAFAGALMNFNVPLTMHVQSLWINAYFRGEGLSLPATTEDMQYQAVLHSRFGKWRYPGGHGSQYPDFVFDAQPYTDLLMRDLGLQVHRKKGFMAESLEPYGPEDYKDVVQEWLRRHRILGL